MSEPPDLYKNYLTHHFAHVTNSATFERKKKWLRHNHLANLPKDREARFLEIGPGFGSMLDLLVNDLQYANVRAVDISPEVVSACNEVVPNSTILVNDTIGFLTEHIGAFECILLLHVLEHVPKHEIVPLLQAIRQALSPEGSLIIEVPNLANPITGPNVRYADFTHTVGFIDLSLKYVLESAGFHSYRVFACTIPQSSFSRTVQAFGQAAVEKCVKVLLRLYTPTQPSILSHILGAIAVK